MNSYANELKARREQARLTAKTLADLIERSQTFVTDFELRKKANPPDPEMMRRLAEVLNWSEDEQLRSWGYTLSGEDDRANPFTLDDPRWHIVEQLRRIEPTTAGARFALRVMTETAASYLSDAELYKGPKAGLIGNSDDPVDDISTVYKNESL
jgi:transcriptional regulator with XRE-family HTH domain